MSHKKPTSQPPFNSVLGFRVFSTIELKSENPHPTPTLDWNWDLEFLELGNKSQNPPTPSKLGFRVFGIKNKIRKPKHHAPSKISIGLWNFVSFGHRINNKEYHPQNMELWDFVSFGHRINRKHYPLPPEKYRTGDFASFGHSIKNKESSSQNATFTSLWDFLNSG